MANALLSKSRGNWIHGRCVNIIKVTSRFLIDFKCCIFKGCHTNVDQKKKLHDVNAVTDFSYLADEVSTRGGFELVVISRT